jgi:putative nucleotidyltransferase with HDIG domain
MDHAANQSNSNNNLSSSKQNDERSKIFKGGSSSPTIALEVVELTKNPNTSASRIGDLIASDEALSNKILKVANSPMFGLPRRISTLSFAVVVLGFDSLRTLVTRLMVGDAFRKIVDTFFNYQDFWDHSVACGVMSRLLARKTGVRNPDHALVAGLLHDVGYLVFQESIKDQRNVLKEIHEKSHVPFGQVIEAFCGISHQEAGSQLAERWMLPEGVSDAIMHHHQPQLASEDPGLTAIVHVADVLCSRLKLDKFQYETLDEFEKSALAMIGLTEDDVSDVHLNEYLAQATASLNGLPSFEGIVATMKNELVNAIADLPDREKLIVALHYYEGVSLEDITSVVELDLNDVIKLHDNAMDSLQSIIECRI